jgi:hypothetical protein
LSCDIKQYGALKHNEDGEYNKEEVDGMVKTCAMEDVDWAPSTTVPGPEAFIPAVPTNVGNILGGENGEGDGSGKAHTLAATVRSITVVDPNRSKGAGDCKDGKSCSYLNNEDSAMENRNKLRLNAAAQGIVLGQQAVALATESGKDVDDLRKEIEYRDDVLRMLKGIAKLQAQHLQKTNAITAMRAKLVELSAIGNIASGSIYTTKSSKK